MALFPERPGQLASGPARFVRAPISQASPGNGIYSVIGGVPPYDPIGTHIDFGSTIDEVEVERDMDADEFRTAQSTLVKFQKINELNRTIKVNVAEISPENLRVIEESPPIETITAGPNRGSQRVVPIGNIESLTRYRMAVIFQHPAELAPVTMPSGEIRGAFIMYYGLSVSLAADDASIEIGPEDLAAVEVTFALFGDPLVTDPKKSQGGWYFEDFPQTIAA